MSAGNRLVSMIMQAEAEAEAAEAERRDREASPWWPVAQHWATVRAYALAAIVWCNLRAIDFWRDSGCDCRAHAATECAPRLLEAHRRWLELLDAAATARDAQRLIDDLARTTWRGPRLRPIISRPPPLRERCMCPACPP